MSDFATELKKGRYGESEMFKELVKYGVHIVPTCDLPSGLFSGPRMQSTKDLILPDAIGFAKGTFWIEIKTKTRWTRYRKDDCWETGIDMVDYDRYVAIRDETKHPVILLFWQRESTPSKEDASYARCPPTCPVGKFWVNLDEEPNHKSFEYGKGGMVYWRESQLKTLEELFPAQTDLFA